MQHPTLWNKESLYRHLQHAIDVELWTIPLYLTALYSIRDLKKLKHHDYPPPAKLLFSVVAQEMLHLELVCNVSNALGYLPVFTPPVYNADRGIPFIHPAIDSLPAELHGYSVKPRALNKDCLILFCAIELPHHKGSVASVAGELYCSIGEFYEALKSGVQDLWDECYIGDEKNTNQKMNFLEFHNSKGKDHGFSQSVNSLETALLALDAIICQGEGADSKKVPIDFRPHEFETKTDDDISLFRGELSHYTKFRILLHSHLKLPAVYAEIPGKNCDAEQVNLEKKFLELLRAMEDSFRSPGESLSPAFWDKMNGFGEVIVSVWESGACPDFEIIN